MNRGGRDEREARDGVHENSSIRLSPACIMILTDDDGNFSPLAYLH